MKLVKLTISFFLLMLAGMLISYADIKSNNEYYKLIETFNDTQANFKFYNIKANGAINYNISKNDMRDICIEIINNLGLEESNIKWEENWNKKENQIYAQVKTDKETISIIGIKKNNTESYIIVDILENKVYKNIVDIYTVLENTLNKHTYQLDINTCISGEYTKKLQINKYDDILQKILYNMNAEEIDRVEEENFVSITAYSEILNENYLEYLGNKTNLNIGMRYSEDDDKTLIYIATPIIKLDY
ncbi:YwmB family TATA-box binding protein [Romboutsia sp.]|uniref:YwmB family TATA-box binding protein n=1 Tax=Romboutsia sp. TaxID=1965302 RepID=UPI002BCE68F1|nr:YwmB family TATA-box binding protein [Romboutsia sp.]HSQ87318.1 YwmB family TATA-box binding protein [Romboutsia sp.]